MGADTQGLIKTASKLCDKANAQRGAHYAASDHLRVGHYIIGVLLIVLSAIVSGSVLQASDGDPSQTLTIASGAMAVAVVILTSVQTTFKLGERAEQHRSAASGMGKVARKLQIFMNREHKDLEKAWKELIAIEEEFDAAEAGAPGFLTRTYDKAKKR